MNPVRRLLPEKVAIELFTHRLYGPLVPVSPSVPDAGTRRAATAIEGVLGAATLIFSLLFFLFFCLPNRRRGNLARNRAAIAHACPDRRLHVAAAIIVISPCCLLQFSSFLSYTT